MHTTLTASTPNTIRTESRSLVSAIRSLRDEFSTVAAELRDAQSEIARLRRELTCLRAANPTPSDLNLASLRREVTFACHPDRGGNEQVMCRVNVLFDHIERNRQLYLASREEGALA
jgi:hypothetical protein